MVLPASHPSFTTESSKPISAISQLSPIFTSGPSLVSLPSSSHSVNSLFSSVTRALPPQGLLEAIGMNLKGYNFFSIYQKLFNCLLKLLCSHQSVIRLSGIMHDDISDDKNSKVSYYVSCIRRCNLQIYDFSFLYGMDIDNVGMLRQGARYINNLTDRRKTYVTSKKIWRPVWP